MAQVKPEDQPPVYTIQQQPAPVLMQPQPSTTVIVNQGPTGGMKGAPRLWNTGICGCFEDIPTCVCGTCCSLCLSCQVASDMGESPCVMCCVPGPLITLRTKWRTQENIQGSIMGDCIDVSFCGYCVLCQLAREVKTKRRTQPL